MKDRINYFLFCLVIGLCHILPQRFLYWIALRISDLNWMFDRRGREAVQANLRQVLPDAPESRIRYETRWVFRNFGKYLTEFFSFRQYDEEYFKQYVSLHNADRADKVLEAGNGCILITAHVSNWELGAAAVRVLSKRPLSVVAAMHRYGKVNELFVRERAALGMQVIDMEHAPREVFRRLKNNEVVGIVGDRDPTSGGVWINFFGRPCRFPQGPARFSISTGAAVIPTLVTRRTNDCFTVKFGEPIYPPSEGTRDDKVRFIAQTYAKVLERHIMDHPEEWTVFYRVWDEEWRT